MSFKPTQNLQSHMVVNPPEMFNIFVSWCEYWLRLVSQYTRGRINNRQAVYKIPDTIGLTVVKWNVKLKGSTIWYKWIWKWYINFKFFLVFAKCTLKLLTLIQLSNDVQSTQNLNIIMAHFVYPKASWQSLQYIEYRVTLRSKKFT